MATNLTEFLSNIQMPVTQDNFPGSPDSRLSDISFPSHVSGLESFFDVDDDAETTLLVDDDTVKKSKE